MARSWEDTYDDAQKRTEDVRKKMFIDSIKEKVPAVDPDLAFLTPTEVLDAIENNQVIKEYHDRIADYEAPGSEIGLLFPDSDRIPWTRGKTTSLPYRNLYLSLKNLKIEDRIAVYTISPILGVVPREWYDEIPMYDASGTLSFMVRRRGLSWNADHFRQVLQHSGRILADFMKKNHDKCRVWHAIVRNPSMHKRILEEAIDLQQFSVWPHYTKKSLADSYLSMKKLLKEVVEDR